MSTADWPPNGTIVYLGTSSSRSSASAQRKTVGLNLGGDVGKPPLQF
jgi:hypothetical protein